MKKDSRGTFVYWLTLISALLAVFGVATMVISDASVRWTMNREFTFLSDGGMLGLCILALGLVLGLVYSQRS